MSWSSDDDDDIIDADGDADAHEDDDDDDISVLFGRVSGSGGRGGNDIYREVTHDDIIDAMFEQLLSADGGGGGNGGRRSAGRGPRGAAKGAQPLANGRRRRP